MPKVAIYNIQGSQVGEMELSEAVFGAEINQPAVHQVIVALQANSRQGTQSALTRSEVRGGGKKPYRQKGTGRARQGSTRSPQWKHGGIVFAPKPRSYRVSVNKKMRRLALKSALTSKVAEGQLIVVDEFSLAAPKTKEMVKALTSLNADKALIVTSEVDDLVIRTSRNIPKVDATIVGSLNVYDILSHNHFVVTKAAVEKIQEVYA